jgi:hypothetical protein
MLIQPDGAVHQTVLAVLITVSERREAMSSKSSLVIEAVYTPSQLTASPLTEPRPEACSSSPPAAKGPSPLRTTQRDRAFSP